MPLKIKCLALTLDQGLLVPPALLVGDSRLGPLPGNDIFQIADLANISIARVNLTLAGSKTCVALYHYLRYRRNTFVKSTCMGEPIVTSCSNLTTELVNDKFKVEDYDLYAVHLSR